MYKNVEFTVYEDILDGRPQEKVEVELLYPRTDDVVQIIEIGLSDTRASDGILVRYDFDRNGWVIYQASTFSWPEDDTDADMDWQEVAFVESWAREKPEDE